MNREEETQVLVVGAGPVGMLTALLLAEEGVQVQIIDREWRTAAHSYACALHPRTLRLLARLGVAESIVANGRRIDSVAFYDGQERRAEMKLSKLPGAFPYGLVLPQSSFEGLLEERLKQKHGIQVQWNHRLADLQFEQDAVIASIDKLKQTAKGYIVPEYDWSVQKRLHTRAAFVVGADGHGSMVRSRLEIDYEKLTGPEMFAVFEFETAEDPGHELRVVMDNSTTNVLWPLPGKRCRWTFQLIKAKNPDEFPDKEREAVRVLQEEVDRITEVQLKRLAESRAPWFKQSIEDVYWWTRIAFEHRLAKQFGKGRGWLVGDAAHQTGPVGVQSMNEGMHEAEDLAGKLAAILKLHSSRELLTSYGSGHHATWERLFGRTGGLRIRNTADAWARDHAAKLLACIPASGEDLVLLANQAGFDF